MLASEFINTITFGIIYSRVDTTFSRPTIATLSEVYDKLPFFLPRLYCKDGFNISVQVNFGNYCASENGTRTFGLNWCMVEWGFPSQEIDPEKYSAENNDTINSVGGYVNAELIDQLCEEHKGFDLTSTLKHSVPQPNQM